MAELNIKITTDYKQTQEAFRSVSDNVKSYQKELTKAQSLEKADQKAMDNYINSMTGRTMELWNGSCHVHARFSAEALMNLKQEHPQAKVLTHPECKQVIINLSDVVGSTQALLNYVREHKDPEYIIVTEWGVIHEMQKACPEVRFIPVPPEVTEGVGCSCNECEYMRMITLEKLRDTLRDETNTVKVPRDIAEQAVRSIRKMLAMS